MLVERLVRVRRGGRLRHRCRLRPLYACQCREPGDSASTPRGGRPLVRGPVPATGSAPSSDAVAVVVRLSGGDVASAAAPSAVSTRNAAMPRGCPARSRPDGQSAGYSGPLCHGATAPVVKNSRTVLRGSGSGREPVAERPRAAPGCPLGRRREGREGREGGEERGAEERCGRAVKGSGAEVIMPACLGRPRGSAGLPASVSRRGRDRRGSRCATCPQCLPPYSVARCCPGRRRQTAPLQPPHRSGHRPPQRPPRGMRSREYGGDTESSSRTGSDTLAALGERRHRAGFVRARGQGRTHDRERAGCTDDHRAPRGTRRLGPARCPQAASAGAGARLVATRG